MINYIIDKLCNVKMYYIKLFLHNNIGEFMNNLKLSKMYIEAVINPLEKLRNEFQYDLFKKLLPINEKEQVLLKDMDNNLIKKYKFLESLADL